MEIITAAARMLLNRLPELKIVKTMYAHRRNAEAKRTQNYISWFQ